MSYEYSIVTKASPSLSSVSARLTARGLEATLLSGSKLLMTRQGSTAQRLERWGADVEIAVGAGTMMLTIHDADHADLLDELKSQGVLVSIDEP